MRFGLTILPEHRWVQAAPMWRRAEELGFDHAWTYDHLVWGGLPDSPWYGTTPTLTAAAMVTSTIRLGTFVTSPNYRHPVTLMRDLLALDDISGWIRLGCAGAVEDYARLVDGLAAPLADRLRRQPDDHDAAQERRMSRVREEPVRGRIDSARDNHPAAGSAHGSQAFTLRASRSPR